MAEESPLAPILGQRLAGGGREFAPPAQVDLVTRVEGRHDPDAVGRVLVLARGPVRDPRLGAMVNHVDRQAELPGGADRILIGQVLHQRVVRANLEVGPVDGPQGHPEGDENRGDERDDPEREDADRTRAHLSVAIDGGSGIGDGTCELGQVGIPFGYETIAKN